MIKEEYVQHDTAKLLKDAGFPQDESLAYEHNGVLEARALVTDVNWVSALTQAQAMRWLREEKRIWIEIYKNRTNHRFRVSVWEYGCNGSYTLDDGSYHPSYGDKQIGIHAYYDTYEEAAESGIQTACRKIVEK